MRKKRFVQIRWSFFLQPLAIAWQERFSARRHASPTPSRSSKAELPERGWASEEESTCAQCTVGIPKDCQPEMTNCSKQSQSMILDKVQAKMQKRRDKEA